jgi:hypothetical protein
MNRQVFYVWCEMRRRCTNPTHRQFKDYGGRGITFCERWQSFAAFTEDMGERPEGGMLERVDNDGPYSPENCRWATRQEQNSNRRNCIYVDCDGERVTLKEYCRRKGMTYRPVVKRIQDYGWPLEEALTVPVGLGRKHRNQRKAA